MRLLRALLIVASTCAAVAMAASAVSAGRLFCPHCQGGHVTEIGSKEFGIEYRCERCQNEFFATANPDVTALEVLDAVLELPRPRQYDFSWLRDGPGDLMLRRGDPRRPTR